MRVEKKVERERAGKKPYRRNVEKKRKRGRFLREGFLTLGMSHKAEREKKFGGGSHPEVCERKRT